MQRALRGGIYAARELLVLGFVKQPRGMKLLERVGRRHIESALQDPALLAKATPDYTVGCKRILPSNDWYPALARDNVELVTDGVAEVRERSIVLDRRARAARSTRSCSAPASTSLDMPVGQAGPRRATAARWPTSGTARRARTWA